MDQGLEEKWKCFLISKEIQKNRLEIKKALFKHLIFLYNRVR